MALGFKKAKQKNNNNVNKQAERIAIEEERVYRRGVASIKDLIAPASFVIDPSFLRLGDVFLCMLFAAALALCDGWMGFTNHQSL